MEDRLVGSTNLTAGATPATIAKSARNPLATFLATSSATTTSMTTANGETCPITDTRGSPIAWRPDGRPIATATGRGLRPGDGPGSRTSPGALLHFTTDAGRKSA